MNHEAYELSTNAFAFGGHGADHESIVGAKARAWKKKLRAYKPGITPLERQLNQCAEAYDELHADYVDATGREPARYDMSKVIDVAVGGKSYCQSLEDELRGEVGAAPKVVFIRYPNGGYRAVSPQEAAKYNLLSLAAKKLYQARHDPTCASTVSGKPPSYYRMVQTPGGITLRMAAHLADQWKALSPAQQRSLLWRATRNRGTTRGRTLPCR